MIWVDYVFIVIVLLSVLVGVFRGLVREALSLVVWVLAFALTLRYAPRLAEHLEASIRTPAVRTAAAYALVFFGVLIVGAVITWAVSLAVKGIGLGGIDRMLGGGFGLLRGIFILAAIVMLAGTSASAKNEPWWKESILVPQLAPLSASLQSLIPEQWLAYLRPRAVEAASPNSRPEH
ncbi:MAG: colicin V production protein [Nevskia sp.]